MAPRSAETNTYLKVMADVLGEEEVHLIWESSDEDIKFETMMEWANTPEVSSSMPATIVLINEAGKIATFSKEELQQMSFCALTTKAETIERNQLCFLAHLKSEQNAVRSTKEDMDAAEEEFLLSIKDVKAGASMKRRMRRAAEKLRTCVRAFNVVADTFLQTIAVLKGCNIRDGRIMSRVADMVARTRASCQVGISHLRDHIEMDRCFDYVQPGLRELVDETLEFLGSESTDEEETIAY